MVRVRGEHGCGKDMVWCRWRLFSSVGFVPVPPGNFTDLSPRFALVMAGNGWLWLVVVVDGC